MTTAAALKHVECIVNRLGKGRISECAFLDCCAIAKVAHGGSFAALVQLWGESGEKTASTLRRYIDKHEKSLESGGKYVDSDPATKDKVRRAIGVYQSLLPADAPKTGKRNAVLSIDDILSRAEAKFAAENGEVMGAADEAVGVMASESLESGATL